MTVQRSRWRFNRPTSLAYLEILLEAAVALIFATEVSLDCGALVFPEWHDNEFVPSQRTGFFSLFPGTWQENDAVSSTPTSSDSIDRVWMPKKFSLGSIILIGITGAFYLTFTIFLFVNRSWKPPVLRVSDKHPPFIQCPLSVSLSMVSFPQAVATAFLVMSHTGWFARTGDWWTFGGVAFLYFSVILGCLALFLCEHLESIRDAESDRGMSESVVYKSTERTTPKQHKKWNTVRMCRCIVRNVFCCISCIARVVMVPAISLTVLCVLAISPALPALICAGMIWCLMALCGVTAAFFGGVFLVCLLIMYSTGRMLGLWMSGSNVAWTLDKICSLAGYHSRLQELFPSETVQENYRDMIQVNPFKRRFGLALQWVEMCVLFCTAWRACVSGIIQTYGNEGVLKIIREWTLLECTSSMLSQVITGANTSTSCVFSNDNISPLESRMRTIGYLLNHTLGLSFYSGSIWAMAACLACIIVRMIITFGKLFGRLESVSNPESLGDEYTTTMNEAVGVLYLAPLSLVKIVLPVYGLDFVLPGRFYAIGLTAWLVGYTALFGWECVQVGFEWVKALLTNRVFSRREEISTSSLIGMDDDVPAIWDVVGVARNTAQAGFESEVAA